MPIVVFKPDALSGRYARVSRLRAAEFLSAMARHFGATHLEPDGKVEKLLRKAQQHVIERAASDPMFVGPVRSRRACAERLLTAAALARHTASVCTATIATRALVALGFGVLDVVTHVFDESDLVNVYSEVVNAEEGRLRRALHRYLVGHSVCVVRLDGAQHPCVLQHWKTFLRHAIQGRTRSQYRLRNLVHVCGRADGRYLNRLLWGRRHWRSRMTSRRRKH